MKNITLTAILLISFLSAFGQSKFKSIKCYNCEFITETDGKSSSEALFTGLSLGGEMVAFPFELELTQSSAIINGKVYRYQDFTGIYSKQDFKDAIDCLKVPTDEIVTKDSICEDVADCLIPDTYENLVSITQSDSADGSETTYTVTVIDELGVTTPYTFTDTNSITIVAPADGVDAAGNNYTAGDTLIQLPNGDLLCVEKATESVYSGNAAETDDHNNIPAGTYNVGDTYFLHNESETTQYTYDGYWWIPEIHLHTPSSFTFVADATGETAEITHDDGNGNIITGTVCINCGSDGGFEVTSAVNGDGDTVYTATHTASDGTVTSGDVVVPQPSSYTFVPSADGSTATITHTSGDGTVVTGDVCIDCTSEGDFVGGAVVNADGSTTVTLTHTSSDGTTQPYVFTIPVDTNTQVTLVDGDATDGLTIVEGTNADGEAEYTLSVTDTDSDALVSDGTIVDFQGNTVPSGEPYILLDNGDIFSGACCDDDSDAIAAPSGGTDAFGNVYNAGDNIILLDNGDIVSFASGGGNTSSSSLVANSDGTETFTHDDGTGNTTDVCVGGILEDHSGATLNVNCTPLLFNEDISLTDDTNVNTTNGIGVSGAEFSDSDITDSTTETWKAVIVAQEGTNSGNFAIVSGRKNDNTGASSFVNGLNNNNAALNTNMGGSANTNIAVNVGVWGNNNDVSGGGSHIGAGTRNTVSAGNNAFSGSDNIISGTANNTTGASNTVTGDFNLTGGDNNQLLTSGKNVVVGSTNLLDTSVGNSVSGGNNELIGSIQNNVTGAGNILNQSNQNVVGGNTNVISESGANNIVALGTTVTNVFNSAIFGQMHDFQTASASSSSLIAGQGVLSTAGRVMLFGVGGGAPGTGIVNNFQDVAAWNLIPGSALTPTQQGQFTAVANDYTLFSNAAQTSGVNLASGSSAWAGVSARSSKHLLESVDYMAMWDAFKTKDINKWSYIGSDDNRHIGIMADDFYDLAGEEIGTEYGGEKIETMDVDGVAMALLKAAQQKIEELELRLEKLEK